MLSEMALSNVDQQSPSDVIYFRGGSVIQDRSAPFSAGRIDPEGERREEPKRSVLPRSHREHPFMLIPCQGDDGPHTVKLRVTLDRRGPDAGGEPAALAHGWGLI